VKLASSTSLMMAGRQEAHKDRMAAVAQAKEEHASHADAAATERAQVSMTSVKVTAMCHSAAALSTD